MQHEGVVTQNSNLRFSGAKCIPSKMKKNSRAYDDVKEIKKGAKISRKHT